MLIDLTKMRKIHDVQYEMMIELIVVMNELKIKYYFVHGSLLGAVTTGQFIPEDDDIDIAIFREDYNKLMEHGSKYLKKHYFLQSSTTDDFPLAFAKMRDSRTTFRQPVLENYNCNKGIYIDIFPIDYVSDNYFEKLKVRLLNQRLNSRLSINNSTYFRRFIKSIVTFLYPSWQKAADDREMIYSNIAHSNFVSVTNGKSSEQCIPIEWFSDGLQFKFRDIKVNCPSMYSEYLSTIYCKNFEHYNPAENRIFENNCIKVSADLIEFDSCDQNI
ncbi:phosphorylcholine transferase LicD [Vibrio sp. 10N.222.51.C8]|uniref:LicD family protein n=1 Tax=Vibrio sp. 10N.222.51.C8 TaxID=3229624 RepID=UPI0035543093